MHPAPVHILNPFNIPVFFLINKIVDMQFVVFISTWWTLYCSALSGGRTKQSNELQISPLKSLTTCPAVVSRNNLCDSILDDHLVPPCEWGTVTVSYSNSPSVWGVHVHVRYQASVGVIVFDNTQFVITSTPICLQPEMNEMQILSTYMWGW